MAGSSSSSSTGGFGDVFSDFFSGIDAGDVLSFLGSAAGDFLSGDQQQQAFSNLRDAAEFKPFNVFSDQGSAVFDPTTGSLVLGGDNPFQDSLNQLGSTFLDQLTASGGDPNQALSPQQRQAFRQADRALLRGTGQAQDFSGRAFRSANDVISAFQNFDPNRFARNQTKRLNQLARPQEENLVNQRFNNLFASGRIGTTGGEKDLGEIAQALERSQTERAIAGQQLAGQEQGRLAGLASQLFGQGTGASNFTAQRQLNRFNLANEAFKTGRDQQAGLLNLFAGVFNPLQQIQANLLQTGGLGASLGGAQSAANLGAFAPLAGVKFNNADTLNDVLKSLSGV